MDKCSIPEVVAGIKDVLSWSAPWLPVPIGWVIMGAMVVIAVGYLIKCWRGK